MNNIIDQLIDIYHNHENWHLSKLSTVDSEEYFIRLLSQGNIIIFMDDEKVGGYIEFWKINASQLRRILNKKPFFVFDEDITHGNICYVSDIFIHKNYRNGIAFNYMKTIFFNINRKHRYFIGEDANNHRKIIKRGNKYGQRKNHV